MAPAGKKISQETGTDIRFRWLPAAVGVLLCALAAVLWWNLSLLIGVQY